MAEEIKLEDYDDKFGEFFEEIKKNPQYNSDLKDILHLLKKTKKTE